jgi:hypothetical protein
MKNSPPRDEGRFDARVPTSAETVSPEEAKPLEKPPVAHTHDDEQGSRPEPPEVRNKEVEAQVQKAIRNRAISGVEVSVINGTAVLQGRVATERQKRAAERAANSIGGVQRVRNRIVVG